MPACSPVLRVAWPPEPMGVKPGAFFAALALSAASIGSPAAATGPAPPGNGKPMSCEVLAITAGSKPGIAGMAVGQAATGGVTTGGAEVAVAVAVGTAVAVGAVVAVGVAVGAAVV